jgi:hypothetical protein
MLSAGRIALKANSALCSAAAGQPPCHSRGIIAVGLWSWQPVCMEYYEAAGDVPPREQSNQLD